MVSMHLAIVHQSVHSQQRSFNTISRLLIADQLRLSDDDSQKFGAMKIYGFMARWSAPRKQISPFS